MPRPRRDHPSREQRPACLGKWAQDGYQEYNVFVLCVDHGEAAQTPAKAQWKNSTTRYAFCEKMTT
eukprot:6680570-Prorocentrum_lima.AAC.1